MVLQCSVWSRKFNEPTPWYISAVVDPYPIIPTDLDESVSSAPCHYSSMLLLHTPEPTRGAHTFYVYFSLSNSVLTFLLSEILPSVSLITELKTQAYVESLGFRLFCPALISAFLFRVSVFPNLPVFADTVVRFLGYLIFFGWVFVVVGSCCLGFVFFFVFGGVVFWFFFFFFFGAPFFVLCRLCLL